MQLNYLPLYWPFKLKKGDLVLVKDALNHTHAALVDTVLNDNFSQSYYLLINPETHVELGWFRRSQITRRLINLFNKAPWASL